jgi:hypothetical protein
VHTKYTLSCCTSEVAPQFAQRIVVGGCVCVCVCVVLCTTYYSYSPTPLPRMQRSLSSLSYTQPLDSCSLRSKKTRDRSLVPVVMRWYVEEAKEDRTPPSLSRSCSKAEIGDGSPKTHQLLWSDWMCVVWTAQPPLVHSPLCARSPLVRRSSGVWETVSLLLVGGG